MITVRQKLTDGRFSITVANVSKAGNIISVRKVKESVSMVMKSEGARSATVSVVLVNDARMKEVNAAFLRHHYITDVITFPLEAAPNLEAEIYVNLQQAKRQAKNFGVTARNETVRLIVHGALHVLGYDDRRTKQRKIMFEKQEQYVAALLPVG